jgi:ribonuclease P protein component
LRAGFVISRRAGSAVLRNRVKRVLKETLRSINLNICRSFDILFVIRGYDGVLNAGSLRKDIEDRLPYLLSEKR